MAGKKKGKPDPGAEEESVQGTPLEAPEARREIIEEQAMLGRLAPLERAMIAFGLEPEHVLGSSVKDTVVGVMVTIVTQGGQRLRWPQDEGRVLAQHEKDGTVPGAPPAGIFPARK